MPADIFISYAREDRARIEKLAAALEAEGFSLWWDRDIAGGTEFTSETELRLSEAKAVLVAWSKASVGSTWVCDEATIGRERGNLVPVAIDAVAPRLGFRSFQTIDLAAWRGERGSPAFTDLVRALKARVAGEPPAPARHALPTIAARLRNSRTASAAAAAAAIVLVAGGAFVLSRSTTTAPIAQAGPAPKVAPEKAALGVGLGVVPFTNLSSDPEQEHFADGLTEELLNWLGNVEGLRVPGRTSSFQFKGRNDDLRVIGDRLGVDYLLEGSVRRSGDALRITAQLIEAETGYHLWSAAYDRKLADIFAIQGEIARIVVTELLGKIPESGVANPAPVGDVDPRAHELYLEGRALWASRQGARALKKFREAVAVDPGHALAQAFVAVIAASFVHNGLTPPGLADPDAAIAQALAEAVRLRPNAADVLFARAWVAEARSGTPPGSLIADRSIIEAYEAAVRANPRHVEAMHALTRAEASPERQIALYERILAIDPGHGPARGNLIMTLIELGNRDKAAFLIRQGLLSAPNDRGSLAARAKTLGDLDLFGAAAFGDWTAFERDAYLGMMAASLLADLGAVPEARFLAMKEAAAGDPTWRQHLRVIVAALDGDPRAERAAAEAFHRGGGDPHHSGWMLANALIRTGDYGRAYEVIIERRPEIAKASLGDDVRHWDELADMDFVTAAHALDLAGRRDEARALWKALAPTEPLPKTELRWIDYLYFALVKSRLGEEAESARFFRAAYDAGFRYLASYSCGDCVYDGFSAESGLFAPLVAIPENAALVAKIKAENAATLEKFNTQYEALDRIRKAMATEVPGADN